MDKKIYDIWLSLALTPGSDTFLRLKDGLSEAKAIFAADEKKINSLVDHRSKERARLLNKDLSRAEEIYKFCTEKGVGMLTYDDPRFPESLRKISNPPSLLYYRGRLPDFNSGFYVSVVGTRYLSKYGRKNAFCIAHDLAKAGAVVVSGMAQGIDGVATAGAISANGVTVAVLGSGIDVCYPPQHKRLAREIVKSGCVLTELAPGTKPERFNFPRRNRIISGLSAATLVIEGPEISGSLITARCAKEQERPVYALPGNVENKNSEVPNLLLKNGARVCTCADDIIRDFENEYRGKLNPFMLADGVRANMDKVLREYSVSATSNEDDIFLVPRRAKAQKQKENTDTSSIEKVDAPVLEDEAKNEPKEVHEEKTPTGFDERTLKLYKRIPRDGSCLVESLVDSENTLRDVMKSILKLEMGRFVKMLPGERVARNL